MRNAAQRPPLIIIIPGILGSSLSDKHGKIVYDIGNMKIPRMDPDRLTMDNDLYPVDLIENFGIPFKQLVTGYGRLTDQLRLGMRLTKSDIATSGPDNQRPEATLVKFPYDFRQSIAKTAHLLNKEIRLRADGRQVAIIAHSMGGLVANYWWTYLSDGIDVKRIVTIGTPYRGAPKALDMLINGVRPGGVELPGYSNCLRTWESPFALLPQWKAIEGENSLLHPHELPDSVTKHVPQFEDRASCAYDERKKLAEDTLKKIAQAGAHPFEIYYSQERYMKLRCRLAGPKLTLQTGAPYWLPEGREDGDGTVPMFAAIPEFLDTDDERWERISGSHQDLPNNTTPQGKITQLTTAPSPHFIRGATQDAAINTLRLEMEDVVPANTLSSICIHLSSSDTEDLDTTEIGGSIAHHTLNAERDGDRLVMSLPSLEEGVHTLRVRVRPIGIDFAASIGVVRLDE